jgi:predicted PhzF superfamily epimerase YddE/YHI9
VAVTAAGHDCDFVSRFFTPQATILEDPVTGSAHCSLTPYWSERLGKKTLEARQISHRRGELRCELKGDLVHLLGHAVTYSAGHIQIDED